MDWWLVTLILGELAFVCFIIWVALRHRQNRESQRSDERLRLIERFETSDDLAAFLASEPGARFVALFKGHRPHPLRGVVAAVSTGIVGLFLGAAFLLLSWLEVFDDPEIFLIPGVLISLAACGVLAAAAVSLRLIRAFRLGEEPEPEP